MIWRIAKVCEMTGLKKGAIYKLIRECEFPKPLKLTSQASGWDSKEVENWIEARKAAR